MHVERFIHKTYSQIKLEVVNWPEMPFRQQIHELHATTVLITPPGDVSSIVPFLPKGAHAIIIDYHVNKQKMGEVGELGSVDSAV